MNLRSIARLVVDAARIELQAWANPGADPEPVAAKPAPAPASRWQSPAYHIAALGSSVCPDCDGPKSVGSYRCTACHAKALASRSPSDLKEKP